jgi:hypothetical protein
VTPEEFNSRESAAGRFTEEMVTRLVSRWQVYASLGVDGYCGILTQASLRAELAGVLADTSPIGRDALSVAIAQVGHGESGGNNSGEFVEMLHGKKFDGDDDDDGAWCAAFVSWCFEEACEGAGVPMPFKRSGAAKALYRRIGRAGSFPTTPAAGDVVCWDRGKLGSWQGHIGIVERYDGGILHTVEGNVGAFPSKVRRFSHDLTMQSRLEGFARAPR